MKRALAAVLLLCAMTGACAAYDGPRYEYRIVKLGSLSSLQDEKKAAGKMDEIEEILDREGSQGWEVINIFAVRTTFDPNVFFAAMKRQLP